MLLLAQHLQRDHGPVVYRVMQLEAVAPDAGLVRSLQVEGDDPVVVLWEREPLSGWACDLHALHVVLEHAGEDDPDVAAELGVDAESAWKINMETMNALFEELWPSK